MARMTRRRFGGSTRKARRPVQWIAQGSSWNGNAALATTAGVLFTQQLIQTGKTTLTSGGDTYVMQQRMTLLRTVGDLVLLNNDAAICPYSWGIILADEVAGVGDAFDPTATTNVDKSWLLLRHGFLQPVGAQNDSNVYENPFGAHFDVKVKRIIRADQNLMLMIKTTTACNFYLNARMLVSRVA